jgi:hypothetical protein
MRKTIKYLLTMMLAIFITSFMPNIQAEAIENLQLNQLIVINEATDVMESPDETSEKVGSFEAGSPAIVIESPENGWIKVKYQDIEGYIPIETVETDYYDEELAQEFDAIENEFRLTFEVIEYEKKMNQQKLAWGIIIGGLIIAMFIVGIMTGVHNKKREK